MKTIIHLVTLSFWLLGFTLANAQVIHEFPHFPFDTCLSKLENNNLVNQLQAEFNSAIDSFQVKREKKPFDFKDQWKVTYYVHTGWEEGFRPNEPGRVYINDIYQCNKPEKYLSGKEVLAAFDVTDSSLNRYPAYEEKRHPVSNFLQIPVSYRGFWTPIISPNGYLIIFSGHSYPNGNARSWVRNYYYYFEKIKQ